MTRGIQKTLIPATIAAVLLLGQVMPAFAAMPPSGPMEIMADDFESTSLFTPSGIPQLGVETPAWWGVVGGAGIGGTNGLWCAGTTTTSSYWPSRKYPDYTAGNAILDLPALVDYYSSSVTFRYNMPSLGVGDTNALRLFWGDGEDQQEYNAFALTGSTEWRQRTFDLSAEANSVNLSRLGGTLNFRFRDIYEPPVLVFVPGPPPEYGNWIQVAPVRTGKGPTIDDFVVSGYMFGPVRGLSAAQGAGEAQEIVLSWSVPAASTAPDADDESRPLRYRVWRSPASATPRSWTEVTPSRISATTLTDSSVEYNTAYVYVVQAWDPTNEWYGELSPEVLGWAEKDFVAEPGMTVNVVPSKTSVISGESVTFTYTVTNTGNVPLTDVAVETGELFGTLAVSPAILGPGGEGIVARTKTMTASVVANATATAKHDGVSIPAVLDPTPAAVTVTAPPPPPVITPPTRISGPNRFATAVAISQRGFPNAASVGDSVVIANGMGWADALPASSLAGALDAPLLLVQKGDVPNEVANELKRLKTLGVTKAYVVGGDAVVGTATRNEIKSILGTTPARVEGANRYETAFAVAESTRNLRTGGATGGTAFVATGLNFPDALAASSVAAAVKAPIVLTQTGALPPAASRALANLKPNRIVICGGTSAVSAGVETTLKKSFPSAQVVRQWGNGRYDTAKAIVTYGKTITGVSSPRGIFLATGTNYPDALAGGVLAGIAMGDWTPLMLTDPARLSPQAASVITANPSLDFASVLGGTSAVSEGVRTKAVDLIR